VDHGTSDSEVIALLLVDLTIDESRPFGPLFWR